MALIELSPHDLARSRLSLVNELKQSDAAAAKEAYTSLLNLISSPLAIIQGRTVRGTTAIQRWLNVVILINRVLWPLTLLFAALGVFIASRYFVGSIVSAIIWWLLSQVQFQLNIELAARFITLRNCMTATVLAAIALVEATRDSLREIKNPRFFETERGYQGELLAEIRKRLPAIQGLSEDAVIEQEYQKRAAVHGLKLRPDLIIHVPIDNAQHSDRREGNYICFELKLRAAEAEARDAYQNLSSIMQTLNYPVGIFVNIDSSQTHISSAPKTSGIVFAFAVSLRGDHVEVCEDVA